MNPSPKKENETVQIVQREHPVLRGVAKAVPASDITKPKIREIVKRMKIALGEQADGVAIAAPQIGEPWRIFVVSQRFFQMRDGIPEEENAPLSPLSKKLSTGAQKESKETQEEKRAKKYDDLVFINPEILKISRKKSSLPEGCLSVRWLYGKVLRAEKAKVRALGEDGKIFEMGGSGLLAQIFQHEIDHLNGILFIDTAKEIENAPPEKEEKRKKKTIE